MRGENAAARDKETVKRIREATNGRRSAILENRAREIWTTTPRDGTIPWKLAEAGKTLIHTPRDRASSFRNRPFLRQKALSALLVSTNKGLVS